MNTEEKQVLKK